MTLISVRGLMMGMAAAVVAACASAPAQAPAIAAAQEIPDLPAAEWRRILQQQQTFAVYVSQPAVREGDLVHFRMTYITAPGEVLHQGREVALQEYRYVTMDCAEDKVRMGPRTRYAPDGTAFGQDDSPRFDWIIGGAVVRAKDVYCNNKPWEGMYLVPAADGWIERERAKIPAGPAF